MWRMVLASFVGSASAWLALAALTVVLDAWRRASLPISVPEADDDYYPPTPHVEEQFPVSELPGTRTRQQWGPPSR